MHALVDQIEASLSSKLYFLSLSTSLMLPDIAGALDSDNGEASGTKYAAWFEQWVRPRFSERILASAPLEHRPAPMESPLTGDACYRFRCSLLHQGSSQHPKSPFSRIMFIEPSATPNVFHYVILNDALCIDLNLFCLEIVAGTRLWLAQSERNANYVKNYDRFARRYPDGLSPYIGGVAVIA